MSIKLENLTKYYGDQLAVNNISFEISSGEIVGFLGPNGAGKTTTLRMITTFLSPSSGNIYVDGINAALDPIKVRRKIGYLSEQNPLYNDMNVVDFLIYNARLQMIPEEQVKNSVDKMVKVCGLQDVKHKDIRELSKGYRQRVGLAQAMIHDPEILLLDEPTSGLDPNQILEIRKLIKDLGRKKTLVLSTHILQEVQAVCDRIIIIHKGEIKADAKPDELQKEIQGQNIVILSVKSNKKISKETLNSEFKSINGVEDVLVKEDKQENIFNVEIKSSKSVDVRDEVFKRVIKLGLDMVEMKQVEATLEDIFRKLTN